jgi:hypothetical protein
MAKLIWPEVFGKGRQANQYTIPASTIARIAMLRLMYRRTLADRILPWVDVGVTGKILAQAQPTS